MLTVNHGVLPVPYHINDIVKAVSKCRIELFSDDTMIYFVGEDLGRMQENVNQDSVVEQVVCKYVHQDFAYLEVSVT